MPRRKPTVEAECLSPLGLCDRCEHRACFREGGPAPRCECKDRFGRTVSSCYCYTPVRPVTLARSESERRLHGRRRPITGLGPVAIAARMSRLRKGVAMHLVAHVRGRAVTLYWAPSREALVGSMAVVRRRR